MEAIGFVGLGHMGNPMVSNLLKAGHMVHAFDTSAAAMSSIREVGAMPAESLQEVAEKSQVIFTMLQTGEQVHEVCAGENGLFAYAKPETLFIDCSSIDVEMSRRIHQMARDKNFQMLDAPVSGGVAGAISATLTIMVGGEGFVFMSKAEPILKRLGKLVIHVGQSGNGQAAKICNNMLLGISMIGVSEAFKLGEKLGLNPENLFKVMSHSSGQCWALTSYCPIPDIVENVPSNNEYIAGFTSQMMLKDLNLSQQAATEVGFNTPLGALATQLYEKFVASGHKEMDFSGIINMIAKPPEDQE